MSKRAEQIADYVDADERVVESFVLTREVRLTLEVGHEFWQPDIRVKIWFSSPTADGDSYFYTVSHRPHTPLQASPYSSSRNHASTEEKAIKLAISNTCSYLKSAIEQGEEPEDSWLVPNKDF